VVDERGKKNRYFYPTEKQARQVVRSLKRELGEIEEQTIGDTLDKYELYMRDKGNKPKSVGETSRRLRLFFGDVLDLPLRQLDESRAAAVYEKFRTRPTSTGNPPSVDYHRNSLAEAKTFLSWCATKKKWIGANPMEHVEGVGKRRRGKPQLRVDESRKWLETAVMLAEAGEQGAVAAMMTILLGMRCSEITSRVVRDVDDGGRLLWIPDSKTDAGRRTLEVPEVLVPFLAKLAGGRKPNELLFGQHWRDWPRLWVQRICKKVGIMEVTAHGMRGTHATLATDRGVTGHTVAAALGHTSPTMTYGAYAQQSAVGNARQRRVVEVLDLSEVGNDCRNFVPQADPENTKGPASARSPS
jgi:integrase